MLFIFLTCWYLAYCFFLFRHKKKRIKEAYVLGYKQGMEDLICDTRLRLAEKYADSDEEFLNIMGIQP